MGLFEFELDEVQDIRPWGPPEKPDLSWYALSYGTFRMVVGDQCLFRYSDEIMSHWPSDERDATYQIAAFVQVIMERTAAAVSPLPPNIERLVSDWPLLWNILQSSDRDDDLYEDAWTWLFERDPVTSFLVQCPRFYLLRVGDQIRIHWENRENLVDGIPVWTAQQGVHILPVEAYLDEYHSLKDRLLTSMAERIHGIETGRLKAQIALDTGPLKVQHQRWIERFDYCLENHEPQVPWPVAEEAIKTFATRNGFKVPY